MTFQITVEYKMPGGKYVTQDTGFPDSGMPFELHVNMRAKSLVADLYPRNASAYDAKSGAFVDGGWDISIDEQDFESHSEAVQWFMMKLEQRMLKVSDL